MEPNMTCGKHQKLLLRYVRVREGRRGRGGEKDLCTERQQKFGPLINGTKHDLWEASKAFIEVCQLCGVRNGKVLLKVFPGAS